MRHPWARSSISLPMLSGTKTYSYKVVLGDDFSKPLALNSNTWSSVLVGIWVLLAKNEAIPTSLTSWVRTPLIPSPGQTFRPLSLKMAGDIPAVSRCCRPWVSTMTKQPLRVSRSSCETAFRVSPFRPVPADVPVPDVPVSGPVPVRPRSPFPDSGPLATPLPFAKLWVPDVGSTFNPALSPDADVVPEDSLPEGAPCCARPESGAVSEPVAVSDAVEWGAPSWLCSDWTDDPRRSDSDAVDPDAPGRSETVSVALLDTGLGDVSEVLGISVDVDGRDSDVLCGAVSGPCLVATVIGDSEVTRVRGVSRFGLCKTASVCGTLASRNSVSCWDALPVLAAFVKGSASIG